MKRYNPGLLPFSLQLKYLNFSPNKYIIIEAYTNLPSARASQIGNCSAATSVRIDIESVAVRYISLGNLAVLPISTSSIKFPSIPTESTSLIPVCEAMEISTPRSAIFHARSRGQHLPDQTTTAAVTASCLQSFSALISSSNPLTESVAQSAIHSPLSVYLDLDLDLASPRPITAPLHCNTLRGAHPSLTPARTETHAQRNPPTLPATRTSRTRIPSPRTAPPNASLLPDAAVRARKLFPDHPALYVYINVLSYLPRPPAKLSRLSTASITSQARHRLTRSITDLQDRRGIARPPLPRLL